MLRYPSAERGFVLLVVLLFMLIMAMLAMSASESQMLAKKISSAEWQDHSMLLEALQILKQTELQVVQDPTACHSEASDNLLDKPRTFWQEEACAGQANAYRYYYLVEDLGADPCAKMKSKYVRLTLLVLNAKMTVRLFLQSVVAIADPAQPTCGGTTHGIVLGRQLWRTIQ